MMDSIDQQEKNSPAPVYDVSDRIWCANPDCNETFEKGNKKKYHSLDCKNSHHKHVREVGKQSLTRGKIHAALLENSPRLQRVAKFLGDGKPHSTRDIIRACDVCAVNAIVDELREPKNGFDIECKQISKGVWEYTMLGGFTQLLRLPQEVAQNG